MVVKKSIVGQIENRNFLAPTGFKFQLNRTPKVTYFGNAVNIPSIDLGVAEQPTYLRDIPLPGDKLQFADFRLRFLVDEGLEINNALICCENINPQWEVACVRCLNCDRLLLNHPRPDLGRIRTDGFLKGGLRVLLLDSRPLLSLKDEE